MSKLKRRRSADGLFRIVQPIPSPEAEPFIRWLAQMGYERVKMPKGRQA